MLNLKSTLGAAGGAALLLMTALSLPALHAADAVAEDANPSSVKVLNKVVIADADSHAGIDIEAIRTSLQEKLGAERSSEILTVMEPLLNKLQSINTSDMSSEEIQSLIEGEGTQGIQVLTRGLDIEVDAAVDGEGHTVKTARVMLRKVGEDGEVSEELLEGDEALEFVEGNTNLTTHLQAEQGGQSQVDVKVMRIKGADGDVSKLLKFETALDGSKAAAHLQEIIKKLQSDLEDIEIDQENVVIVQADDTDALIQEVHKTDEEGKTTVIRKKIVKDLDTHIEEALANGEKIITKFHTKGPDGQTEQFHFNSDKADNAKIMTWTTNEGGVVNGHSKRIMVFIDAEKLSSDAQTGPGQQEIEKALVEAEVIVVSDETPTAIAANAAADKQVQAAQRSAAMPRANAESGLQLDGFNVYPNPNDGRFNLEFNLPAAGPTTIKIIDIQGREVFREDFVSSANQLFARPIDLSGGAAGTYLLSVTQNDATAVKKIEVR